MSEPGLTDQPEIMKLVLQRVTEARVLVLDSTVGVISSGLVVFLVLPRMIRGRTRIPAGQTALVNLKKSSDADGQDEPEYSGSRG